MNDEMGCARSTLELGIQNFIRTPEGKRRIGIPICRWHDIVTGRGDLQTGFWIG
jgi:hypothetical protein